MSKYFKTKEDFERWIVDFNQKYIDEHYSGDLRAYYLSPGISQETYVDGLIADGYTDLNNLVEDGRAYAIGKYKNNGWVYRDEISPFADVPEERIRDRVRKHIHIQPFIQP